MSYSFNVKAASKAEAKAAAVAKVEEIVFQQGIHSRDREAIISNINLAVDLLQDDDSRDVSITANGYLSFGGGSNEEAPISQVSISAGAGLVPRV